MFLHGGYDIPLLSLFVVKQRLEETAAVLRKTETCKLQLLYLPLGNQDVMVFSKFGRYVSAARFQATATSQHFIGNPKEKSGRSKMPDQEVQEITTYFFL